MIRWHRDFPALPSTLAPPTPAQRVHAVEVAIAIDRLREALQTLPQREQRAIVDAISERVFADG